jgi:hypothetical protein
MDSNSDTSQLVLNTKHHLDYIYMYTGQNYTFSINKILIYLNKLSSSNKLAIYRRQVANRDVRILLPFDSNTSASSCSSGNSSDSSSSNSSNSCYTSSRSYSSDSSSSAKQSFTIYSKLNEDRSSDEDERARLRKPKSLRIPREIIENRNYHTFVYNFNRIALACYLKVLKASRNLWASYSLDENLESNTNFSVLNKPGFYEKSIELSLSDDDFVKNYLNLMIQLHNQIIFKLYLVLNSRSANNGPFRVHFNDNDYAERNETTSEKHLFRTFRIVSLRKPKLVRKAPPPPPPPPPPLPSLPTSCLKRGGHSATRKNNYNCLVEENNYINCDLSDAEEIHHTTGRVHLNGGFNQQDSKKDSLIIHNRFCEMIDLRVAFDIRQFQCKTGYDCFIESEMSYFKIVNYN